jgi:hypothetical protein
MKPTGIVRRSPTVFLKRKSTMSVLNKIAYFQGRRDEIPNQELAKELAETKDKAGIQEIADNLWHKNQQVQSNCLKVLYEIGYLQPDLIADYSDDFFKLLQSRNNRLVWSSMIALSTIAEIKAGEIFGRIEEIKEVMERGSVITVDSGIAVLATIAAKEEEYRNEIFPYLVKHLETCRSKDIPQHSEKIAKAVDDTNRQAFISVLENRMVGMKGSQAARVRRVIKQVAG